MSVSHLPSGLYEPGQTGVVPTQFVTGIAGSGKTFEMLRRIQADPSYGVLSATTGISAMNLGTITINSLLRYFDTASLEESFFSGFLVRKLTELSEAGYQWLIIDEISMCDARQLDIIYQGIKLANETAHMEDRSQLGIIATGDFCQLPPIKAKWAFLAECWPQFEASTTRLTKVWRQLDARFLEAVNAIRSGNGPIGAVMLQNCGVEFVRSADTHFEGTTIMAKNKAVDNFNWLCHSRLAGVPICVQSSRWGEQRKEWSQVPLDLQLKPNSYVMILANNPPAFDYVNGDCGHIRGFENECFQVELVRNGAIVDIPLIARRAEQKNPPDLLLSRHPGMPEAELRRKYNGLAGEPFWDAERRKWVTGAVIYYPLRLAYASTVHKTQGLTLDRIQVDVHDHFFGSPAMAYVAISRCRTAAGLRIVGSAPLLASRVKVDPAVARWL